MHNILATELILNLFVVEKPYSINYRHSLCFLNYQFSALVRGLLTEDSFVYIIVNRDVPGLSWSHHTLPLGKKTVWKAYLWLSGSFSRKDSLFMCKIIVYFKSLFISNHCLFQAIVYFKSLFISSHCLFQIIVYFKSLYISSHCSFQLIVYIIYNLCLNFYSWTGYSTPSCADTSKVGGSATARI